ncbi:hypothetical protein C1I98_37205 [Spongiactinospora gelatinilytica]|uniref:Uncharacterized protein n=1 Tax=Spongiactinospora gelatinilytica TaxID=2666298 RepID=A0A2W2EWF1_9ACTN|nr:hypothetical protein [Spongiactinospora gelatinilytica]PZG21189.1 hypothetical protein C1I98_37205 [Spongiactinospora gelatinilytica]
MTTTATPATPASARAFTVAFPEAFTPAWSRIDGITIDGPNLTLDPAAYFFRYDDPSWLVCDWELVRAELLDGRQAETPQRAAEQRALEFIHTHGRTTRDPAEVLRIGYQVASFIFRDELLEEPGLDVTPRQLVALREATTIMSLNKVQLDGTISNVGPCWFFPIATSVVFELPEQEARSLDELYHGMWFNEYRRIESVLAHAALGGRLVHGCQAAPDMRGGCVLSYGTDLAGFRRDLETFDAQWKARIEAMRAA